VKFLIKWLKKSHLHNTWNTFEELNQIEGIKGLRKLKNYIEGARKVAAWLTETTIEDKEEFYVAREKDRLANEQFKHVERIIAQRTNDEDDRTQYYVKWSGLSYSESTWEYVEDISSYQQAIDDCLIRDCNTIKVQRSKKRDVWTAIEEQPEWICRKSNNDELRLRLYQLAGVNWLLYSWSKNTNVILGDEMGLGKTIQCICFLGCLSENLGILGPHLVVVPLSTLSAWKREFAKWTPFLNLVAYRGDAESRRICREYEFFSPGTRDCKFNVLLTTPELLRMDKDVLNDIKFQTLIVDEAHRLKDHASAFYQSIVSFSAENIVLVTGTPIQNHLGELWSLLHILDAKQFDSLEEFLDHFKLLSEFKEDSENDSDKMQLRKLHENIVDLLKPHLLRRTKRDVEKDLPDKNESILRVGLAPLQKKYYQLICQKNFYELKKNSKASKASLLNILMEMKKCCNHPFLLDYADERLQENISVKQLVQNSGKMILLDKMLTKLKEQGHRVLIFSQMVRMLDVLSEYLVMKGWAHQRLDGTVKHEERQRAMDTFNAPDSKDFCFLLSTRAGGLGINLATADTVIIYDADYNPQNDLQAEARAHRIGQKNIVNIYRFVTRSSVEEKILESAKRKMVLGHVVVEGVNKNKKERDNLAKLIQFGAQNLFQDQGDSEELSEADIISEIDLEQILKRNLVKKEAELDEYHEPEDSGVADFLSAFKVANFARAAPAAPPPKEETPSDDEQFDPELWDKLIPADVRPSSMTAETMYYQPRQAALQVKSYNENKRPIGEVSDAADKPKSKRQKTSKKSVSGSKAVKTLVRLLTSLGSVDKALKDPSLSKVKGFDEKKLRKIAENICSKAKKSPKKFDFEGTEVDGKALSERVSWVGALESKLHAVQDPYLFRINFKPKKPAKWPVDWTVTNDSMLLVGVHVHGFGSWDAIFEDDKLGFSKMIDKAGKRVLTTSMLKNRVSYLLGQMAGTPPKEQKTSKDGNGKEAKEKSSKEKSSKEKKSDPKKADKTVDPKELTKSSKLAGIKRKSSSSNGGNASKKPKSSDTENSGAAVASFEPIPDRMKECIEALNKKLVDVVHVAKLKTFFQHKMDPASNLKTFGKYLQKVSESIKEFAESRGADSSDTLSWELHFWTLMDAYCKMGPTKLHSISNRLLEGKDFADLL
jgi:chromodomain-helicase-DNA-binding protein 1